MLLPFKTNKLFRVLKWAGDSSDPDSGNPANDEEVTDLNEADIVTSMVRHTDDYKRLTPRQMHTFVVDLDMPATLVPSSTPGHSHLYIDCYMQWEKYVAVLEAMADAGILERGYVGASKARGFTAVRLPWVRRTDKPVRRSVLSSRGSNDL